MHRRLIVAITFALLGTGIAAQAQGAKQGPFRYKWVDAQGLPHYSDSLTEQAIKRGYDVVNNQGLVVQHVPRPMTRAERAAAEAKNRATAQAQAERLRRQQEDAQMLAAYPTEADFAATQQAELDNLSQAIHTIRMNLRSQEQNLSALLAHAANIQSGGGKVPANLSQRIAEQRQAVTAQRAMLDRQIQARAVAEKDVQAKLARYRMLRARQQAEDNGP
jgi:hypothetical protein